MSATIGRQGGADFNGLPNGHRRFREPERGGEPADQIELGGISPAQSIAFAKSFSASLTSTCRTYSIPGIADGRREVRPHLAPDAVTGRENLPGMVGELDCAPERERAGGTHQQHRTGVFQGGFDALKRCSDGGACLTFSRARSSTADRRGLECAAPISTA